MVDNCAMASEIGLSGGIGGHTDPIDHQHGHPLQPDSPWAKQNVLTFGMTLDQTSEIHSVVGLLTLPRPDPHPNPRPLKLSSSSKP
jgi:hypothetical protein